jgi:hypothetical protein
MEAAESRMPLLELLECPECLAESTETALRNRQEKQGIALPGTAVQQAPGSRHRLSEIPLPQKRSDLHEFLGNRTHIRTYNPS